LIASGPDSLLFERRLVEPLELRLPELRLLPEPRLLALRLLPELRLLAPRLLPELRLVEPRPAELPLPPELPLLLRFRELLRSAIG
jgi:hypothetical protein